MMWFIFPSITVLQLINDVQYLVDQRDGRMRTWELQVAMLTYTVWMCIDKSGVDEGSL
jgi:hypothetical protein